MHNDMHQCALKSREYKTNRRADSSEKKHQPTTTSYEWCGVHLHWLQIFLQHSWRILITLLDKPSFARMKIGSATGFSDSVARQYVVVYLIT